MHKAVQRRFSPGERLRGAWYGSRLYGYSLRGKHPANLAHVPTDPWPGEAARADALFHGDYAFADAVVSVRDTPPWRIEPPSEAWLAELHGFSWLRHFTAQGGPAAKSHVQGFVKNWLDDFAVWHEFAWRPDILARRLIAWSCAGPMLVASNDLIYRSKLLNTMARQARHLARVAGQTPDGPARLIAVIGLVYSGLVLPEGEKRLAKGLALLDVVLAAQVLPDGGYVTRSPADQLAALGDLAALRRTLLAAQREVPESLQNAIDRMAPMVRFFRHGDGRLCLFNGAWEDSAEHIDFVLSLAEAPGKPLSGAPHSGFHRLKAGRSLIIADCGAPPPGALSAHAHAGIGAFEMSIARDRLVVNCGVAAPNQPEAARWRAAGRASAAHSTLTLDNTSSSAILENGCLGRVPSEVTCTRQEEDGRILVELSHDGYDKTHGVIHRRRLFLDAGGGDVRGADVLTGHKGRARAIPFAIRFHLHPDVMASISQNGEIVMLRLRRGAGWEFRALGGAITLEASVYLGAGGPPRRAEQIVIAGVHEGGETAVKWSFKRAEAVS